MKRNQAYLLIAIVLLALVPGHDSLWIDEAYNASYARLSTFKEFLHLFLEGRRSENQMPLGMFASWIGGRLVGTSEFQLRAINWLWGALALISFWGVGRRLKMPWLPLFATCQPFFWFYFGEARPYAMQIGCAAALMFGLLECLHENGRGHTWLLVSGLAGVALCGSSLLGVIPFAVICLTFFWVLRQLRWQPDRFARIWLIACFLVIAGLGLFYAWTLSRGATGAKIWPVGFSNIGFGLWEFAGFSGLGPSRQLLREMAHENRLAAFALLKPFLPYLTLLLGMYAIILVTRRHHLLPTQFARLNAFVWIASFVALAVASFVVHFPFWGRHLAPAFPFFVLSVSYGFVPGTKKTNALLAFLMLVLLASSLQLRFASRHAKDDYRTAADVARAALSNGKKVLWVADPVAADYYGVPVSVGEIADGRVLQPRGDQQRQLAVFGTPDLIVLSKPSIYDAQGFVRDLIQTHRFEKSGEAQAFQFWKRP